MHRSLCLWSSFPRSFLLLFEACLALRDRPLCPATSHHVMPHLSISPQRDPDSVADAAGQAKGSGGNVIVACHHVRSFAWPSSRQAGSQPPGGCRPKPQPCQWASKVADKASATFRTQGPERSGSDPRPEGTSGLLLRERAPHPSCPSSNSGETNFFTLQTWSRCFSSGDYRASARYTVSHGKVWVTGWAVGAGSPQEITAACLEHLLCAGAVPSIL